MCIVFGGVTTVSQIDHIPLEVITYSSYAPRFHLRTSFTYRIHRHTTSSVLPRVHDDIITFVVEEGERVMAKNLNQAESPVLTIEHMISTEACLVVTVTG